MKSYLQRTIIVFTFLCICQLTYAQRIMEKLGRGVVATRTATNKILVSWRLLGTEPQDIGFNVYRSANGGAVVKLNSSVLTAGTNFEDLTATSTVVNTYFVKTVVGSVEGAASSGFTVPANTANVPFYKVPIVNVAGYGVRFVFVGDLDGDGEFDFVLHKKPLTDASKTEILEAYKSNGTLLWTLDGGPNSVNRDNISPGSSALNCGHGDNITVYDINNDGKAEVIMRTSNGVKFADGSVVTETNNSKQFISIINGLTGKEISRTLVDNPYLSVGPMNGHMGIAYLDGIHPSVVWESANRNSSGSFNEMVTTWNWNGTTLVKNWMYDITNKNIPSGHQFKIFDIDGDGKDEIVPQGYALDDDGTLMYNLLDQAIDHGDRFFISDLDPSRPGLEMYGIQQGYSKLGIMWYYCDAKTGKVLLSQSNPANPDMGRGMNGDFDPRYNGHELFTFVEGLYNVSGAVTSTGIPGSYPNFRFLWDADLGSENLDNLKFTKWNYLTNSETRLYTASGVLQVDRNTPLFYGDIMGDWREEVIYESSDRNSIVIYTSPSFTTNRIYTLAHNPGYRSDMAVRGYYQSHNPDFFLGFNMQPPPIPSIQTANSYWMGNNTSVWDKSLSNWTDGINAKTFADGDTIMFDIRGNNTDTIKLNTDVSPGRIWAMNADGKNYTIGGTGKLSGTMDLWKARDGIFTLKGNHDYTGATVVSEGLFNIDGSIQSNTTIKGLGAIGGRGTLAGGLVLEKSVNVKGGRISPGFGNTNEKLGTLKVAGNLSVSDNNFEFDVVPGTLRLNDSLIVTGNLAVTGTNKIIVNFADDNFVAGIYTLISCKGTLSASLNNFVLEGISGVSKELFIENNEVKIKINPSRSPGNIVWKGAPNNLWNFDDQNFLLNSSTTAFVSGDNTTFNDVATQKVVELNETLYPSAITFDATSDYTIQGSGKIGGATGITKNNTGNLSLLATGNTYTGKTIVNGGKLVVTKLGLQNEPSSIGAAGAAADNIQLNNAILEVNERSTTDRSLTITGSTTISIPSSSSYAIFNSDIKGTGSLTKEGDGAIFMVGAKNFTGSVVIKSGAVNLRTADGNVNGLGKSNNVTLENATLAMEDVRSYDVATTWNLTVPQGKTGTFKTDGRSTLLGGLFGAGTLNVEIPYVRTDFKGNWSQFTGKINITAGDFRIGNNAGYANAAINLIGGTIYTISGAGSNIPIGELSGSANLGISLGNWLIGAKNTDATFSGNIVSTSLTKTGTGTFTVNGNNTYTGNTTVNAGKLIVNNAVGKRGIGTGTVTVANGAVLGGTGGVRGAININTGGIIQPGSASIGTFKDSTSVTFASGAIAEMEINSSSKAFDVLKVVGSITFNGKLIINKLTNSDFNIGDSFKLFDANTYSGDFTIIEPATPGTNLEWKFIPSTGTLTVVAASLPVSLLSFDAKVELNKVKLIWSTVAEINNDYFQIERSTDGKVFMPILKVKGAGTTNDRNDYSIFDNSPVFGYNYYQLKQYDLDGTMKIQGIKTVNFGDFDNTKISIFPNPFSESFSIQLQSANNSIISVAIKSVEGLVIENHKVLTDDSGLCEIKTKNRLPHGIYFVSISGENLFEVFKVMVK